MSSTEGEEKAPAKAADGDRERGGGLLPALLAGAGLLVVAGLLVFGPGRGSEETESEDSADKKKKKGEEVAAKGARGPKGGVGARNTDEAQDGRPKPRVNPRIERAIPFGSMAEQAPPGEKEPPTFADKEEEITYWEKELTNAQDMVEIRKRALQRMDKIRSQIEDGTREAADKEKALDDFERRKGIVVKNLETAEAELAEIEGKLSKLRG
jgi:hypothetical protein